MINTYQVTDFMGIFYTWCLIVCLGEYGRRLRFFLRAHELCSQEILKVTENLRNMSQIFKLRLGAFIPRSVGRSVCRAVLQKLQKNYKTLQILTKRYKTSQNIEIWSIV